MSQTGQQTIIIWTLLDISSTKDNQVKKLGQLQNITQETFFLKNHA